MKMEDKTTEGDTIESEGFLHKFFTFLVSIVAFALPFWIFMKVFTKSKVVGRRNLLQAGLPYIFVSNHVSMLDDAFIGSLLFLPRGLWDNKFMPYHTPEYKNFYVGPIFSWIMDHAKCIPLTRGKGLNQPGIYRIIKTLQQGGSVVMYPEGTRTRTGRLGSGKPGIGKVIYQTRCQVIPCYHSGLEKVLPIGKKIPRYGQKVTIKVGKPVNLERFFQMEDTLQTWKEIAAELINAIRTLRDE